MNFKEAINKIKLNLFGNPWTVWLVKILRYAGGGALFYLISKSPYLFPDKTDFFSSFTQILKWHERDIEMFLSFFWILVLITFFLAIYFYLSGILVEWLIRIELSPHQQIQILSQKTYSLQKDNYSVSLDRLEVVSYSSSPHTTLKGIFTFQNKQKRGKVNFIGYSHASVLKPYLSPSHLENNLPATQINFSQKALFTWQKVVLVIILAGGWWFFVRVKKQAESLPKGYKLGEVLKGQAAKRAQEVEEAKQKKEKQEERWRRARITPHNRIKTTWGSIGGLRKAKASCKSIAEAIVEKNRLAKQGRKPLKKTEHILLYGPPGTGKTLLAKAMAKHIKGFFLDLSGADFQNDFSQVFSGNAINVEEKIKQIFDIAIEEARGETIIALIDEIDRMGGVTVNDTGEELLRILSGTQDERYKNIVIVATTNNKHRLSSALLRPGRLARKELISYPNEAELLEIVKLVLKEYHGELSKDNQQAFNNDTAEEFVRKFAGGIHKLMTQSKYMIMYKDMGRFRRAIKEGRINPDEGRVLFTGAAVQRIIEQAPEFMGDRMTLKLSDFEKSIQRIYEDNRKSKQGRWWGDEAEEFIAEEIDIQLDEDERRRPPQRPGRPDGPDEE